MSARYLTPRQKEVLDLIAHQIGETGVAPLLQEIADALGMSKINARDHVVTLENKGFIRRQKYKARAIELVDDEKTEAIKQAVVALKMIKKSPTPRDIGEIIERLERLLKGATFPASAVA